MTAILLEPAAAEWPSPRDRSALDAEVAAWRRDTLAALDLDPGDVIVATGHQAAIWHAGILAKDLAVTAATASLVGAGVPTATLHYLADHDTNDAGLIRLPALDADGRVTAVAWRWAPPPADRPTRDRPPVRPAPPPLATLALPTLAERVESMHAALARHADQPTLAGQVGRATAELIAPIAEPLPRRSMSGLLDLPVGRAMLDRLRRDPEACAVSHDAAVEADRDRRRRGDHRPRGVARLLGRGRGLELPLWVVTDDGRRPATVADLETARSLRPRALLATALARLGGCDLFVHGTGGGTYDRVMEDWIARWLGPAVAASLAPATVASATCRLPLPIESIEAPITPEDLHRMRFDPDLRRDDAPSVRGDLLAEIDAAPRRSTARREAFRRLHEAIAIARTRGAAVLDEAERRLAGQAEVRRSNDLANDRTWAFPLHDETTLRSLRDEIDAAWSAAAR